MCKYIDDICIGKQSQPVANQLTVAECSVWSVEYSTPFRREAELYILLQYIYSIVSLPSLLPLLFSPPPPDHHWGFTAPGQVVLDRDRGEEENARYHSPEASSSVVELGLNLVNT